MDKKKKNNNEINIKTIWKVIRSEQGKKYSFIIFYLFFFLFLFIFINTEKVNNISPKEESNLPFLTSNLEENYNFKYTVKSNYDELLYKGAKNNNTIIINDDTNEYIFTYQKGRLTGDLKILYKELFDIYEIKRIIKNSKLVSETKLNETNNYIYTYKITNEKLDNILKQNIKNLDLENEITVEVKSNKQILQINYNLINYEKEFNNNLEEFKITLEMENGNG